jgi:hypothetical protein
MWFRTGIAPALAKKHRVVNGSFDNPYAKTQRSWREAHVFESVILADKTHLTAIASTGAPPLYIESIARFIDAYDER